MGFSRKPKVDDGLESEGQKWVLAMISIRAPLKPIYTKSSDPPLKKDNDEDEESSTPTGEEARIRTLFNSPPPAPRKPKASFKCNNNNYGRTGVREFFTPPDLETVFIRERAS
ncbi:glutamate--glyoxylate aminotransferase 2-like isoform X1 [Hibiscus syriacus]|uniref:Glutamate--glyoxylate aminotransferase 2-like isoform X1 n=1 Tax=Hibiscus syriacus TaxID=106335 RepID=A0A6A2WSM0_HIBSY|nr:cyclin-dependent protein kinase inhibitor SMR6-like [Hibiscus syriacus]KAE8663858.1 glutamate--glyoxylate aminotransferase 2-like isoform X1 [Hibiscus syriacus]